MAHKSDKDSLADLGLAPGVSFEDVKKTYRKLAQALHPDRNKSSGAAESFKVISVAYAQLDKRRAEGRWGSAWTHLAPAAGRPQGSSSRSAAAAPLYTPHPSWRSHYFHHATMIFENGENSAVIKAFFKSYVASAVRAASAKSPLREDLILEISLGYMMFLSIYKNNWSAEDIQAFRVDLSKEMWAWEKRGVVGVLWDAQAHVKKWACAYPFLTEAIDPGTLFCSDKNGRSFSVLDAIATPTGTSLDDGRLAWHREIGEKFKSGVGGAENFEQSRNAAHKAMDARGRPFGVRLMEDRPELFAVYSQAGWINPRHGLYAARGFDFATSLWRSEVPWSAKAELLWGLLGPEGCGKKMAQMPVTAQDAVPALSHMFIEAGRVDDVAAQFQNSAMRRASSNRRRFERLSSASSPALGFGLLAKAAAWASRAPSQHPSVAKAFRAVAKNDIDALRQSLSDVKFEKIAIEEVSFQGVPLAVFIAWKDFYRPGQEEFCSASLDLLKDVMGAAALRVECPQGASAKWWQDRKIEVSPRKPKMSST